MDAGVRPKDKGAVVEQLILELSSSCGAQVLTRNTYTKHIHETHARTGACAPATRTGATAPVLTYAHLNRDNVATH